MQFSIYFINLSISLNIAKHKYVPKDFAWSSVELTVWSFTFHTLIQRLKDWNLTLSGKKTRLHYNTYLINPYVTLIHQALFANMKAFEYFFNRINLKNDGIFD